MVRQAGRITVQARFPPGLSWVSHASPAAATALHREGRLARPWTVQSAADMLYALISSDLIEALIRDRRWSARRLADHLATMFQFTFTSRP
jgi:hypothetical protein